MRTLSLKKREGNFQREIIWTLKGAAGYKSLANSFVRGHDTILYYSKCNDVIFNKEYLPYSAEQLKRFTKTDKDGRKCKPITKTKVIYLDEAKGVPITDVWTDIASFQTVVNSPEITNYPTQKPEKLIERIVKSSSNEGDLVLDAFAGSGTTCAVAEKLGRRWVGIDCGKFAIYTVQKRMLTLKNKIGNKGQNIKPHPFILCNAGLYDFSRLKELPWKDWRFFALQLFGCKDEPHVVGGLKVDGKLKGASVLVFNHQENPNKRIDEDTIRDIHSAVGKRIGDRFFVIAPRGVFDFQQDYIDMDGVRYYALRIPYSVINELHRREFTTLQQPNDEDAVNDIVESWGFDFIRSPKVGWKVNAKKDKAYLKIKKFESYARIKGEDIKGDIKSFSMLMVDFDYDGDIFDLDAVFYAHDLEQTKWEASFPSDKIGDKLMAIFIDIHGNEASEIISRSEFGLKIKKAKIKKKRKRK